MSEQQQGAMSVASGYFYNHPADVLMGIEGYRPRGAEHWEALKEIVVTAALATRPPSWKIARQHIRNAYDLALWAWQIKGADLDAESLFTSRNAQRFFEAAHKGKPRDAQERLGHSLDAIVTAASGASPGIGGEVQTVPSPYSRLELAELLSTAASAPTERLREVARHIIALGAGAGLSAVEMSHLRVADVRVPFINVPGSASRLVPMLPEWRDELNITDRSPEEYLILPHLITRRKVVMSFINSMRQQPRLNTQRLRSTWMVRMLAHEPALPLTALLTAAGVDSFQAFNRYRAWVPEITVEEIAVLLGTTSVEVVA